MEMLVRTAQFLRFRVVRPALRAVPARPAEHEQQKERSDDDEHRQYVEQVHLRIDPETANTLPRALTVLRQRPTVSAPETNWLAAEGGVPPWALFHAAPRRAPPPLPPFASDQLPARWPPRVRGRTSHRQLRFGPAARRARCALEDSANGAGALSAPADAAGRKSRRGARPLEHQCGRRPARLAPHL